MVKFEYQDETYLFDEAELSRLHHHLVAKATTIDTLMLDDGASVLDMSDEALDLHVRNCTAMQRARQGTFG